MTANVLRLYKKLLAEYGKEGDQQNLKTIGETLNAIQEILCEEDILGQFSESEAITIHRTVLECDVLYTLYNDIDSFNEKILKVFKFYEVTGDESPSKNRMIGLNLMFLLATNRLSEFHMTLETVDSELQTRDPYISMPVKMEQYLMEGAYNKVILTEKNLPSTYYVPLINILLDTVKSEIAECVEKAFTRIPIAEAARMLLLEKTNRNQQVKQYGNKRGWASEDGHFVFEEKNATHQPIEVETSRLAEQMIHYAIQLEKIV